MNLLIIGGTGVLSLAVVNEAIRKGIKVSILNRGKRRHLIPAEVEFLCADARDELKVRNLLEGKMYDYVMDFICYNEQQISYSLNLFKEFARHYIFISTACVYNTQLGGVINEDSPKVLETWDYSVNKWACENYLQKQASLLGIPYTVVRPCITYDNTRIPYGVMPPYGYHWTFVERIMYGKPIITWDGGNARWSMMRVEDFAIGAVGLLMNMKTEGEAYNICGDDDFSWNEVLDVIEYLLGKKIVRVDVSSKDYMRGWAARKGEISGRALDAVISNEKVKNIVPDFKTNISLEEGINMTLDYYKNHHYLKGMDFMYDAIQDKVAHKYGNKQDDYSIGFVDYLCNSNYRDHMDYLKERYADVLILQLLRKTYALFQG